MQGAQKLRSEAHFQVRRNDEEIDARRRRWTFYETITYGLNKNLQAENGSTKRLGRKRES